MLWGDEVSIARHPLINLSATVSCTNSDVVEPA